MSLQAPISPAGVAVVDLYVARGRLRAEIPMLGFTRLSDLFNNAPGEFIGTSMRMASTINDAGALRRDLIVRLRDVRWRVQSRRTPVPCGWGRIASELPRVVMDLDDWQVTGRRASRGPHPVARLRGRGPEPLSLCEQCQRPLRRRGRATRMRVHAGQRGAHQRAVRGGVAACVLIAPCSSSPAQVS